MASATLIALKVGAALGEAAAGIVGAAAGVTALTLLPKVVGAGAGKVRDCRDQPIGGDL
jgi:hypothetical protein